MVSVQRPVRGQWTPHLFSELLDSTPLRGAQGEVFHFNKRMIKSEELFVLGPALGTLKPPKPNHQSCRP